MNAELPTVSCATGDTVNGIRSREKAFRKDGEGAKRAHKAVRTPADDAISLLAFQIPRLSEERMNFLRS